MPSQLESAINRTRRLMASADAATRSRMVALYAEAIDGLEVALLRTAGIPLEEMTPGQLYMDQRYRQLLVEAEEAFAFFADESQRVLLQAQRGAASAAQDIALPLMRSAAPDILAASFTRLPEAALEELLGTLDRASPVRRVLERFGTQAADAIESEFVRGISQGKNARVIAKNIMDVIGPDAVDWQVERIARTEALRPFRSTLIRTYQQHGHLLDGWRWSAAKSVRTCLACLALDGQVFSLSTAFMGNHPNCRCSPSPYRKGGPAENIRTGEAWFLAQPERTRRKMLPAGAWEPFQDGSLRLADFIQKDHSMTWGVTYRESSLSAAVDRAVIRRHTQRAA